MNAQFRGARDEIASFAPPQRRGRAGLGCHRHGRVRALRVRRHGQDLLLIVAWLVLVLFVGVGTTHAQGVDDFNPGANNIVRTVALQPDGKVIVGGYFTTLGGGGTGTTTRQHIGRLNADGSLDAGFDPGTNGTVSAVVVQPDGKVIVGGYFTTLGGGGTGTTTRQNIGRLNADGSLDASFNSSVNSYVMTLALQPNGKILVGGDCRIQVSLGIIIKTGFCLARLNADGSLDTSFNSGLSREGFRNVGYSVSTLALPPGGRVIVGGNWAIDHYIGRLNADGSLDAGFDPGANGPVSAVALQPDGKVIVGGYFTTLGGGGTGTTTRQHIGRLNADGSLDAGFDPGTSETVFAVALQPDGKVIVGGYFTTLGGGGTGTTTRQNIGRLNADGSLDANFDPGANQVAYALVVQPDGKITVGGDFTTLGSGGTGTTPRNRIGRITNAATITGQPSDQTVLLGSNATFSVGATGVPAPTYQWQISTNVGLTWTNLPDQAPYSGTTTSTLTVIAATVGLDNNRYRSVATNTAGSATSNAATLHVRSAPAITTQPASQTVTAGVNATFTVAASGTPAPTYQWQVSTSSGLTWTNLTNDGISSGVTSPILTLTAALFAMNGYQFRSVATNSTGTATSNAATLTVTVAPGPDLVQNGSFAGGLTNWLLWEVPDIVHNSGAGGVFQFHKANPTTASGQAVIFQNTGQSVGAGSPLKAQFDIGNNDTVRKRISVLVLNSDFNDLSVCTFWLASGAPLRTYQMKTRPTQAWTNASIYFYAASDGTGDYLLDNVSLKADAAGSAVRTDCVDPTVPVPPGGAAGPSLVTNGDFGTGGLAPWGVFGDLTSQVTGGVFEFVRPGTPGQPAGVILQPTGQAIAVNQILTASFQLGNSSAVRKRVTVLLHDLDFSDLTACTFWLSPGQPLSTYTMRGFATEAWTNATLSVYAATTGPEPWTRLDNVTLQRTPGATAVGTECIEPTVLGTTANPLLAASVGPSAAVAPGARATDGVTIGSGATFAASGTGWRAEAWTSGAAVLTWTAPIDLTSATSAQLSFGSLLSPGASSASVQVSVDGVTWQTVATAPPSVNWTTLNIDLSQFAGRTVFVRFVYNAVAPAVGVAPDVWLIDNVLVTVSKR